MAKIEEYKKQRKIELLKESMDPPHLEGGETNFHMWRALHLVSP